MSAAFVFTEEAENQLLDIVDHISAESEDAAARIRQAIHDAGEFWSVFSCLLVYNPGSKPLTVIAVLHGARDVEQLLENS